MHVSSSASASESAVPVLSVRGLVIEFDSPTGPVRAVDGVSFDINAGQVTCIVGESGSGKSLTMLAVMGLLPANARIAGGSIRYQGEEMIGMAESRRRQIRGRHVAMIFQDPMTSLNPVMRVGAQIADMIKLHRKDMSKSQVKARVVELLEQVRIPNPVERYRSYPHEFSGGMRQRAMIAMAMAHNPSLLIADEPTTALDVTIQAQVLKVLDDVRAESTSSLALITHDLGVVAEVADQVVVMYGGKVMETGSVYQVLENPSHPYTVGLLASSLNADTEVAYAVPGQPPTPRNRPLGCVFEPRCGLGNGRGDCTAAVPQTIALRTGSTHSVACHHTGEVRRWAEQTPELAPQLAPLELVERVEDGEPMEISA